MRLFTTLWKWLSGRKIINQFIMPRNKQVKNYGPNVSLGNEQQLWDDITLHNFLWQKYEWRYSNMRVILHSSLKGFTQCLICELKLKTKAICFDHVVAGDLHPAAEVLGSTPLQLVCYILEVPTPVPAGYRSN